MGRGRWGGDNRKGANGRGRRRGKRRGDFTDGYDEMPWWTWNQPPVAPHPHPSLLPVHRPLDHYSHLHLHLLLPLFLPLICPSPLLPPSLPIPMPLLPVHPPSLPLLAVHPPWPPLSWLLCYQPFSPFPSLLPTSPSQSAPPPHPPLLIVSSPLDHSLHFNQDMLQLLLSFCSFTHLR